jgi:hypothetical protein
MSLTTFQVAHVACLACLCCFQLLVCPFWGSFVGVENTPSLLTVTAVAAYVWLGLCLDGVTCYES